MLGAILLVTTLSLSLEQVQSQIATFTCPRGGILFSITPGLDRVGKISVLNHANVQGCYMMTVGRHYQLFVPVLNPAQPPCGIARMPNGNFGATFVTQALPNLYTTIDRKYEVTCQLGQQLSAESIPATITGSVLHGSVMQQTSEVILEIRDISGALQQTSLALGQLAVLYMYLPDTSILKGMDIDSCSAFDSAVAQNGERIQLFKDGCGTNTIFPRDQGFTHAQGKPTSHMVSPAFEMFRFITTNTVVVECSFTRFCTVENDQDCTMSCPYRFNTTQPVGHRRRRAAPAIIESIINNINNDTINNNNNNNTIVENTTFRHNSTIHLIDNTTHLVDTTHPIDTINADSLPIITQTHNMDHSPNTTTHTMVHVFNEDDFSPTSSFVPRLNTNYTGDDKAREDTEVCMQRVWFVLTLSTVGSVLFTLMIVCAICCYRIRKETAKEPTKASIPPALPPHINRMLY